MKLRNALVAASVCLITGAAFSQSDGQPAEQPSEQTGSQSGEPSGLRSSEVSFEIDAGFSLDGTLVLPEGEATEGGYPAVLLIAGSGPTDRDGNQGPMRTNLLRDLARQLGEDGYASLRYDKRAMQSYAENFPPMEEMGPFFRLDKFVGDAERAMAFLREHEAIDGERVAVLGHSEGGLIALKLANGENPPAATVLVATPGRPVAELIRTQVAAQLQQAPPPMRENGLKSLDAAFEAIANDEPLPADTPSWLGPLFNPSTMGLMKDYIEVDPAELAESADGPLLIVNGGADVQVSAEEDAKPLAEAARSRDNGSVELAVVEGASHNLKAVQGEGDPGFAGPIVGSALETILAWMNEHLE